MKYILCLLVFYALAGCESPSIHRINVKIEHDKDVDPKVARHVALAVLKDHVYETKIHVSKAGDEWKISCGKFLSDEEKDRTCNIEYRVN